MPSASLIYFTLFSSVEKPLPIIERNSGNFRIRQIPPAAPAAQPDPGSPPSPHSLPLIQDFFFPGNNPWSDPDYPSLGTELDFGIGLSHKCPFPFPKDGGNPIQRPGMVTTPHWEITAVPTGRFSSILSLNCFSLERPQPPQGVGIHLSHTRGGYFLGQPQKSPQHINKGQRRSRRGEQGNDIRAAKTPLCSHTRANKNMTGEQNCFGAAK